MTPSGRLLESTPTLRAHPLLTPAEAAQGSRGTVTVDRSSVPGLDEPARLLATPFTRHGRRLVLVVGATRENGLEVLRRVRTQLLVGLPLLVLVTLLGAYAVAGAALRPVDAMRRRASELTAGDPALRLPIPPSADEISRLGHTLNSLLGRVEATLERERSFVAHASHELRTPLALLHTQLELAVRRPRPAAELEEAVRSAEVEVERLERLTEDLLLLAQAEEGELALHREEVSLAEVLSAVGARFAPAFSSAGRRLVVAPTDAVVSGDGARLTQALTNLVGNAFEHGGGDVRLEAREHDATVDVVVADRGAGFPPDLLGRATERFVRSPASTGAGLGLAIVGAVAAAHHGSVGVRNVEGGAEAWLRLSLAPVGRPAGCNAPLSAPRRPRPGALA